MTVRRSATPTGPASRPQILVVVHDDASMQRLPAAAAQARRIKAGLLVALARPRTGFTTDAAVARSGTRRTDETLLRRESKVQRLLRGSGVDWTTVRMPFRDSASTTRRARRLDVAAKRLAGRRGVALLPACIAPAPPRTDRNNHQPPPDTSAARRPVAVG